ncbi:hypothetical protein QZH41_014727, partial [Actinostola sp. cb2023]
MIVFFRLVCGEVNGRINQMYNRVKNILKKNQDFEMLLCVGSFFGTDDKEWDTYINGESLAPIITYILGPNDPVEMKYFDPSFLEDGKELCENITYLGRKGILTTPSGLQIAYLSGADNTEGLKDGSVFTVEDAEALIDKSNEDKFVGVDMLLTSCWPQDITEYTTKPADLDSLPGGSKLTSKLAYKLRPRYHFCSSDDLHYERVPYRNHQVLREPSRHVTRFISLSCVGNKQKRKYMYAFNIVPMCNMEKDKLTEQPEDVTELPYNKLLLSSSKADSKQSSEKGGFFYDMSHSEGHGQKRRGHQDGSQQHKQPKGPPPLKGDCWFCLGSPKVEKHLVVSVGNLETLMEIEKFKQALKRMFQEKKKSCVIYERNFYTQHLQLQAVPVPEMDDESLKKIFREEADMRGMQMRDVPVGTALTE